MEVWVTCDELLQIFILTLITDEGALKVCELFQILHSDSI